MFYDCRELTSLNLSNFNTSNVYRMEGMFCHCSALISLDLSSFNTSHVSYMAFLFSGCTSLQNVNLTSFNTQNTTNFRAMFYGCTSLTNLDLRSFTTSAETVAIDFMFYGCVNLKTIYADSSKWDNSLVYIGSEEGRDIVFEGCTSLVGGAGTTYSADRVSSDYARVDGGSSAPGYFTAKV